METWAIITIAVIASLGVFICAHNKWKKYKKKYFTDDPDENGVDLDINDVDLILEGENVDTNRPLHREMDNENYMTTPRQNLQRTNSF
jgi:hypothetical protein